MSILDRFEQSMERLMEGSVGSVFRQSIQPAEIGKKLERAMLANQRASVGTTIVPNAYEVRLHPRDYAQIAGYSNGLSRQFESWLAQVASQRGFSVLDRIRVSLVESETARRRTPIIEATISDSVAAQRARSYTDYHRHGREPAQATAAFQVAATANLRLRIASGQQSGTEYSLHEGSTTIGRSPDNAIVLDAPDVSRRHARIEFSSGRARIYDMNSTNGTRVNGDAVRVADIAAGDELTVGAQRLLVVGDDKRSYGRSAGR